MLLEAVDRKLSYHASFSAFHTTPHFPPLIQDEKSALDHARTKESRAKMKASLMVRLMVANCCCDRAKVLTLSACLRAYLPILKPG